MYTLPYVCVSVLSLFEQRGRCESRFVSPMKMHKSYYMYIPSLHKQILKTLSFWCWWLFNLSKLFNSFNEIMCMICAFIRVFCIFWHIQWFYTKTEFWYESNFLINWTVLQIWRYNYFQCYSILIFILPLAIQVWNESIQINYALWPAFEGMVNCFQKF